MSKRIVFAGTPDFAVPALQALIDADAELVGVYTQPDRPAGRGKKLTASAVKELAVANRIAVYQPKSFKQVEARDTLRALQPDLIVVIAYGLILPQSVLDIPPLGCVNCHASLLPRWRGAAPIQRAIEAGDSTTGITLMQMDAGLDSGAMLASATIPIEQSDNGATLHDKLAALTADLLINNLDALFSHRLTAQPQNPAQVCYAHKLSKQENLLDWQLDASSLARKVRALNPWPVATAILDGKTLRIFESHAQSDQSDRVPGEIVEVSKHGIAVATAEGLLVIDRLQKPGSRAVTAAEFINGTQLQPGQQFELIAASDDK